MEFYAIQKRIMENKKSIKVKICRHGDKPEEAVLTYDEIIFGLTPKQYSELDGDTVFAELAFEDYTYRFAMGEFLSPIEDSVHFFTIEKWYTDKDKAHKYGALGYSKPTVKCFFSIADLLDEFELSVIAKSSVNKKYA